MMMYDAVPTNSEHRYHVVGAYGQCTCKTLRFTILFSPQRKKVNKFRHKSTFGDFQYCRDLNPGPEETFSFCWKSRKEERKVLFLMKTHPRKKVRKSCKTKHLI